jgi:hypothetical protein
MRKILNTVWYHIHASLAGSAIRLHWYRLWVRENEFHSSLDTDYAMLLHLDRPTKYTRWLFGGISSRKDYMKDLVWRRDIAHSRDIPGPSLFYSRSDLFVSFLRDLRTAWRYYRKEASRMSSISVLKSNSTFS